MDSAVIAETPSLNSPELTPSHIVGIGASAGGLSALEQFFDNMPPDTGMAFVVTHGTQKTFASIIQEDGCPHEQAVFTSVDDALKWLPQ